jgi:dTDP-glucose 4,6-dehydratase
MAAIAGVDAVVKSPTTTMKVNSLGTWNLLDTLRPHLYQLERFVYLSTSEVFGLSAYNVTEQHSTNLPPVGEARWVYSVSKLASEHYVYGYEYEFGLCATIVRPFNVYGPGQIGEGAVHAFVKQAILGEPLQVHGTGNQIRSWCYIDDAVHALLMVLEKDEAIHQVFNIGNPRGTVTILDLAKKIVQLANSTSPIVHVPQRSADVGLRIPDIGQATGLLGYAPAVDLDEGLRRTITWYRERTIAPNGQRSSH